ncbi:MAG: RNA polymerase sigma factor [Sedimentisphaerales bacterium]|nr:RNA polymerase sigma factor [Sedimentisphaerales bacterium]
METIKNENKLICEARGGDANSLNLLIEQVCPRLRQCVYRMTLNHHETDDIVQESLIDMAKCLGKLEDSDKFWPWLRRIAFNKLKNSRRKEVRQKDLSQKLYAGTQTDKAKGLSNLISEELSEAVLKSMYELKASHRRVLVLRCYEDMAYSEISEIMERSEFGSRMLFRRAKSALQKRLARNGLSKGALLSALIVFGKLTSDAQGATGTVTVAAQSLKVGTVVATLAGITSLKGIATMALFGITAISPAFIHSQPGNKPEHPIMAVATKPVATVNYMPDPQKITEYWYSFPDGPQGAFLTRFTVRDPQTGRTVGQWLQNETGNYYYNRKGNTVYRLNQRFINSDLSTMRLPTDSRQLTDNLDRTEGINPSSGGFVKLDGQGLLFVKGVNQAGRPYSQSGRHLNMVKEECFNAPWPQNVREVDLRDDLHKQGWTYFTINGRVNGREITGRGRIPFVMAAYEEHSPWIYLNIAGKKYYVEKENYPRGFARPWEGLHTIDTIRRDAGRANSWFSIQGQGRNIIELKVNGEERKLLYNINIQRDIIEKIVYVGNNGEIDGEIVFGYATGGNHQPRQRGGERRIDWMLIGM